MANSAAVQLVVGSVPVLLKLTDSHPPPHTHTQRFCRMCCKNVEEKKNKFTSCWLAARVAVPSSNYRNYEERVPRQSAAYMTLF